MLFTMITVASMLISGGIYAFDRTLSGLWKLPVFFLAAFAGLFVLTVLFVFAACALVNMDKPQEEDSPFYRWLTYRVEEAIMTILNVKIVATGFEKLPTGSRFLLVCNHLHILDPLVLHLCTRNGQLAFISKKENKSLFVVNKLMHKTLCQLIDRENDRAALQTILKCISIIKQDQASIAVFPEGYTSLDGKLHDFRNGVFKIAQKANVPIVVCTLQNTQNSFQNALRLRRTVVPVDLLGVIPPEDLKGVKTNIIGDRVHAMMAKNLGPAAVAGEDASDPSET